MPRKGARGDRRIPQKNGGDTLNRTEEVTKSQKWQRPGGGAGINKSQSVPLPHQFIGSMTGDDCGGHHHQLPRLPWISRDIDESGTFPDFSKLSVTSESFRVRVRGR